MKDINTIIVHCSDSPQGRGDNAAVIHGWHKNGRGFDGIGYHAVILEDGTIENGRPDYWTGAHASGHNFGTLGVCLIGVDAFTLPQFDSLAIYIEKKRAEYGIPAEYVIGHCDVSDKLCPGFDVQEFKEIHNIKD